MALVMASIRDHAAVRCLAAFAYHPRKQRPAFAAYSGIEPGSRRRHHRWILYQRGGSIDPLKPLNASTSATDTGRAAPDADNGDASGSSPSPPSSILEVAAASMSIAGKSSALKSFGGLTYRDALSEEEKFRVIFVLGGPGAYLWVDSLIPFSRCNGWGADRAPLFRCPACRGRKGNPM